MLRTVHVPGLEHTGSLDVCGIGRVRQPVQQFRIVLYHHRISLDLDPAAAGEVHQEQEGLGVVLQVAKRDILPIPTKLGLRECAVIQDLQESWWPAAILDVRLTLYIGRPEIEHVKILDKPLQPRSHRCLKPTRRFHPRIVLT